MNWELDAANAYDCVLAQAERYWNREFDGDDYDDEYDEPDYYLEGDDYYYDKD